MDKCLHRRRLVIDLVQVALLFAAWTRILVVFWRRWGNQSAGFAGSLALIVLYLLSLPAVNLLRGSLGQTLRDRRTCARCQPPGGSDAAR